MRAATFDIETTDLGAVGMGFILCACVKEENEQEVVYALGRGDKPGREKVLVAKLLDALWQYDLLIGHNAQRFDIPFIMTRALALGVEMPRGLSPLLYDTLVAFRRTNFRTRMNGFGKPSGGLGHVADLLHIPQLKDAIYPEEQATVVWDGSKEAMDKLILHCRNDVYLTEQVYKLLWPYDKKLILRRF